ncbi:MAG: hypothetical protein D3924_13425, partial [Candidatus Electrothrix sp. AR4]|nr:hypothetical protein [Candidatus Electrothrix sp. AR4]
DSSGDNSTGDAYLQADETQGLTMRNEISAAANKIWPNGDNKVPDEYKGAIAELLGWDTWTPTGGYGASPYPGETVRTQGIWYDMGNVGAGFDNDNDGVPDKNAWMQPVGDPSLYDAGCFRLVKTYGIVIVKQQNGEEHLIPFEDQLYFENVPNNTGAVGLVFYEYAALNGVCRGALSPYQEVASGYDNEKFAGDYGAAIQLESREPLAFIAKNVNTDTLDLSGGAQTLTYQLEVTNPDIYVDSGGSGLILNIGTPDYGTPVVTRESIPSGTEYLAGSAKFISNGTTTKTGKILYSTNNGVSWTTVEPSPANTVTNIEWWLDEALTSDDAVGENTVKVEFQVSVPVSYTEPYVSNTGCAAFGTGPCFDEDTAVTLVQGSNQITGFIWEDEGTGSDYGDGEKNLGETDGVIGVAVAVYYDTDDSGGYSVGDLLWETLTTDGNGYYETSNTLPDGTWVVVTDYPLPSPAYDGWTNTTDITHTLDGLASGEVRQAPDIGYAPALTLDKDIHNPEDFSRIDDEGAGFTPPINIKEGDDVRYTIDVANKLAGGGASTCQRTAWSTAYENMSNTTTPDQITGAPDHLYAGIDMNNNGRITLTTFDVDPSYSGTITGLELIIWSDHDETYGTSKLHEVFIEVTDGTDTYGVLSGTPEVYAVDFPVARVGTTEQEVYGEYSTADILASFSSGTFTWDNVKSANFKVTLDMQKSGGNPSFDIDIDAVGIRVTTDGSCNRESTILNPVPLKDTFDANELEFVSASPSPDRLLPYDDGNGSTDMYRLEWDNLADSLGDLGPGQTHTVTVNFKALQPSTTAPIALSSVTNIATVDSARFKTGISGNTATDSVD